MSILHKTDWQTPIARTGFLTSLASFLVFFGIDAMRPGFVARYISVHLFLFTGLIFGIWWLSVTKVGPSRWIWQYIFATILAFFAIMLTWMLGEGFGQYRLLMAILAGFSPYLFLKLIKSR